MARISTYAVDSEIVTTDKVIGTDSQGLTTKNFSFSAVKDWLNSSAVVGVVGQNTYTFQTIPGNPVVRDYGSISLPGLGGDGTAFADITSMVFSERAADNSIATNYINTLIGKQVVLMQLDNLNNFGIYNLDSFTPLQGSPGFYTAALSVDYSNGNLISDQNYGFAVYGLQTAGATWGSIQGTVTNQTDLVDYIADEIATIPTPATPTLQSVTDEGNTTTNAISAGTITANNELHLVDSAMRIFRSSNDMRFRTNNSDNMTITSTGRVGIGTTNPISKLELQDGTFTVDNGNIDVFFGGISITRNSANNTALKVNQRGTADIFALQDDGTDVLTVIDGGNVGIGTTEPGSTLPSDAESGSKILQLTGVSGSAGDTAILLRSLDNSSGFDLWHNASSGDSYIDNRYFYGDTIFRVRTASTPNEVVRITPDGNVGIGTTAPGYPLHIVASNNSTVLGLDAGSNARFRFAGNSTSGYTSTFNIDDTGLDIGHDSTARSLNLKTGNQDRLTILGSGNVGIGTTAPSAPLHVVGEVRINAGQPLMLDVTNNIYAVAAQNQFRLYSGGNPAFNITTAGNVGIGTTEPGYKLDVNGIARVGASGASGQLYIKGLAGTGQYLYLDDGEVVWTMVGGTNYSIQSNGTSRLTATAGGNVGIGTTAPAAKLDVDGSIYPTRPNGGTLGLLQFKEWSYVATPRITGNNNRMELLLSGETVVLKDHNTIGDGIQIKNRNNVVAQFGDANGSGNVGIGTTAPDEKLRVQGNVKSAGDFIGSAVRLGFAGTANITTYDTNEDLLINPNGSGDILMQTTSGNVGIGTTAPADYYSNKLVVSAEDESGITLAATTNSAVNHIMFADGTTGSEAYRGYLSYNHLDDSMRIGVGSTEKMRIGLNGAVAIGSTNTATGYALYVAGNVGVSGLATTGDITLGENRAIRNLGSTIIDIDSNNNGTADYFAVTKGGYVSSTTLLKVEQDGDVIVPIGNVGIGTSTPAQKLDVAGYVQSSQGYKFTGSTFGQFTISGGQTYVDYDGDFRFRALPSYNTSFIVTNSGKVGIGTTAPVEKVHINGNLRLGLAGSTGYYISWGQNEVGSTGDFARIQGIRTDAAGNQAGHLTFQTKQSLSGTAPAERLRITDIGNVGIGTATPAAKLHVEGGGIFRTNTGSTPLYITRNGATAESLAIYTTDSGTIFETFQDEAIAGYGSVTFKLDSDAPNTGFNIAHGASPMFRIGRDVSSYVVNTGNFGIGTTNPSKTLHVYGINPEVTTQPTSNGQYAGFSTEYGGEHRMFAGYIGTATTHGTSVATYFGSPAGYKVQIGRAGSTSITIDTSNRVGINTSTPSEALQVNGNVSADSYKIYNNSTALSTTGTSVLTLNGGGFGRVGINSNGSETISVTNDKVGIGTTTPSSKVHINAAAMEQLRMETQGGPANAADAKGNIGDMAYDADFFYIKTSNGWGRVPLDFGF